MFIIGVVRCDFPICVFCFDFFAMAGKMLRLKTIAITAALLRPCFIDSILPIEGTPAATPPPRFVGAPSIVHRTPDRGKALGPHAGGRPRLRYNPLFP